MSVSVVSIQVSSISSVVGIAVWVSIVSVVGIAVSVVSICKGMSVVSVVSISISGGLSSGSGLGISGPLAIAIVAIVVAIWVSIVTMVGKAIAIVAAIEVASISTCFSLASSGGEHAQGNNSNGFHHLDAGKLEDLARLKISLQAPIFIPASRPTYARAPRQAHPA